MKLTMQINELEVNLTIDIISEDPGIGQYEYWGFTGYDSKGECLSIDAIEWDEKLYSPEQNKMIEEYVNSDKVTDEILEIAEKQFNNY